jgi:hypothetical protein
MIIQFNKNITLSEWDFRFGYQYKRNLNEYNLHNKETSEEVRILITIRDGYFGDNKHYIYFYHDLYYLNNIFDERVVVDGDIDFAKKSVDEFLIRMSHLTAFI